MPTDQGRLVASSMLDRNQLAALKLPAGITGVELRRSARRRKTVAARVEGDRVVILLPTRLSAAQELDWARRMVGQLVSKRARPAPSDAALAARAISLARRHLDRPAGRELRPSQIKWVTNMTQRWASCSTESGQIRLSHRLQSFPDWVVDYVIVHELAHLVEPGHGPRFKALVAHYPHSERAQGFLEGWSAAQGIATPDPDLAVDDPAAKT